MAVNWPDTMYVMSATFWIKMRVCKCCLDTNFGHSFYSQNVILFPKNHTMFGKKFVTKIHIDQAKNKNPRSASSEMLCVLGWINVLPCFPIKTCNLYYLKIKIQLLAYKKKKEAYVFKGSQILLT